MDFRKEIDKALLPVISKRCVLLDAPYYDNVGDVLIWEGMAQFIQKHQLECLYRCSHLTYEYRKWDEDVCIFLVGGGNFGDLWRGLQEFRNDIVKKYPNNRIIIFPQSVHYDNLTLLEDDIKIFSSHPDLYLCARDKQSYDFLTKHFVHNHCLLVPDMALYVDYDAYAAQRGVGTLILKRDDKEAMADYNFSSFSNADVLDWPMHFISTDERNCFTKRMRWAHRLLRKVCAHVSNINFRIWLSKFLLHRLVCRLRSDKLNERQKWVECYCEYEYLMYIDKKYPGKVNALLDYWMYRYHRPLIIRYGISFISKYDVVVSTRLHAGVVAALLGKKTYLLDNSYGKISGVYADWLSDMQNVQMIKE